MVFDTKSISEWNKKNKRGIHNGENSRLTIEFIIELLENVKTAKLEPTAYQESLSDTFNLAPQNEWNAAGISFGTLCFQPRVADITPISIGERFDCWYKYIKQYIPEKYRNLKVHGKTTSDTSPLFNAFKVWNEWLEARRNEIEIQLSEKYFYGGRMNVLEILKRRFRNNWSEAKVIDLTADTKVNAKVDEDLKVNITFEEMK